MELIPHGKENAISRKALSARYGKGDRATREDISKLRSVGVPIINLQNGSGYYISDDSEDIKRFCRQEYSRARAIIRAAKLIERRAKI